MRGRAETVRSAAVWADTTRPYPGGQEGVKTMVDISFRVGHEPGTTPFWTQARLTVPILNPGGVQRA